MDTHLNRLRVYLELVDWYERKAQAPMRDRFLVMAADAALSAGQTDEAERLRQRLLQANPHHMLKPYPSLSQALQAPHVQTYLQDLRLNYPLDVAEELMRTLKTKEGTPPPLPRTAPVIAVPVDSTLPIPGNEDSSQIYQIRDEGDPTLLEPPALPPTLPPGRVGNPGHRSDPGIPIAPPVARPPIPSVPQAVPRPQPVPRPPAPPRSVNNPLYTSPPPSPEISAPSGGWLSWVLFSVVVTTGGALALYTLLAPFWKGMARP
jgi:hypothetical protein